MKQTTVILLVLGILAIGLVAWVKFDSDRRIARLETVLAGGAPRDVPGLSTDDAETTRERKASARRIAELETKVDALTTTIGKLNGKLRSLEEETRSRSRRVSAATPAAAVPLTFLADVPRNVRATPEAKRSWGPEQIIGPPNTDKYGDISSAWAPARQNDGEEWVELSYENAVDVSEVEVFETYNPGAISKVVALDADGNETLIWEGEMEAGSPVVSESVFQAPEGVTTDRIKVYLDTTRVGGWNEIDAVKLTGRNGKEQWASDVTSSTSYATQGSGMGQLEAFGGFTTGIADTADGAETP